MRDYVSRKDREEFINLILQHSPTPYDNRVNKFQIARRLMYLGATYGRIQELWCNGPQVPNGLTPEQYKRIDDRYNNVTVPYYERKEKRIEQKITEPCVELGGKPVFI